MKAAAAKQLQRAFYRVKVGRGFLQFVASKRQCSLALSCRSIFLVHLVGQALGRGSRGMFECIKVCFSAGDHALHIVSIALTLTGMTGNLVRRGVHSTLRPIKWRGKITKKGISRVEQLRNFMLRTRMLVARCCQRWGRRIVLHLYASNNHASIIPLGLCCAQLLASRPFFIVPRLYL